MIFWYNIIIRALVSDVTNAQSHHGGIIMSEKLYPIEGYEGLYSITKSGKIWSYPKDFCKNNKHYGIFLKQENLIGYRRVTLVKNKVKKRLLVHRLLAQTFIPNPENKLCINHKNGIRNDNRLQNLEWCTYSENTLHAFKTGLQKTGNNKLIKSDIPKIRDLIKTKTLVEVGRMFGVTGECIGSIKHGYSWANKS